MERCVARQVIGLSSILLLAVFAASCGGGSSPSLVLVSIKVSPAQPSVIAGETRQFTATGTYSNNVSQDITASAVWTSSNAPIASISNMAGSAGLATTLAPGSTTISASFDGQSGTTSLAVVHRPEVAYVANQNAIYQFSIADDGTLHPLTPASVPGAAASIQIDGNGAHAYATAGLGVLQFTVGPNGALTAMTPASVNAQIGGSGPVSVVLHPSGKFAYVAVAGEPGAGDGGILKFAIGSDGSLQSPPTIMAGGNPVVIGLDPKGLYAYVVNYTTLTGFANIAEYTIAADGSLSPANPTEIQAGIEARSIVTDPQGSHLYVAARSSNLILQFGIGTGGVLTPLNPASTQVTLPRAIAVDPNGQYLFVGTDDPVLSPGSVSAFSISSDGSLAALNPATVASGTDPIDMLVEPSGRFVYAANYADNSISEYAIAANGSLTSIGVVALPAGSGAVSIAATR